MTRFHVHLHVADLDGNLAFFSRLFGAGPAVVKPDYAKWMLEDPRLNFAISTGKGDTVGLAHLGLQADSADALAAIGARLQAADAITLAETNTECCYARADKFWAEDPQGLRWESFRSVGEAITHHADPTGTPVGRDCCCGPWADDTSCTDRYTVRANEQGRPADHAACCN